MVLFLFTVYDKHILQTYSALLLVYQCRMKISVTYLEHFESYGELNFKNQAKFCVQTCPIFTGSVTFVAYFHTGL